MSDGKSKSRFIITETGKFDSLDPLKGDSTSNLPVQRMLYSTILEVSPEDDYRSFVLSSFEYKKPQNILILKLNEKAKYSNGTKVTTKDIVFSILRMLKSRPQYPVIDKIRGKKEWGGNLSIPPKGVEFDETTIKISFEEMNFNPLSRFCMEIFSVIPSGCIDPVTSSIICESIPSSGPYVISSESENSVTFIVNEHFGFLTSIPNEVEFIYRNIDPYVDNTQSLSDNEVLASNELNNSLDTMKLLEKKFNVVKKPKVRFRALELRPNGIFQDIECRREFTNSFRRHAKKVGIEVEKSIFTKIMKGYMSFEEHEARACKSSEEIRWGYIKKFENESDLKLVFESMMRDGESFKFSVPRIFENSKEYLDAIYSGEIDVISPSSGFWAADPASDIRMYLTPNMHRHLNFITSDPELQRLLRVLEKDQSSENFEKVNRYLYEDAKFNVYRHAARFYMTNKNVQLKNLPLGITSPAPYTVLEKLSENN